MDNSADVVFILKSRGFGRGSQVTRQYINMFGSTINPEIHWLPVFFGRVSRLVNWSQILFFVKLTSGQGVPRNSVPMIFMVFSFRILHLRSCFQDLRHTEVSFQTLHSSERELQGVLNLCKRTVVAILPSAPDGSATVLVQIYLPKN